MTRLARTIDGRPLLGDEDGFVPLSSADPSLRTIRDALPLAASGTLPSPDEAAASRVSANDLSFAAPLERPGKLWGIGLNYADHASDLNEDSPTEPASFMKPSTTATGPGGPIRLPSRDITNRVTAENEIRNMMTSLRELVSFHSKVMTLEPGDVISTGTPGAKHIVSGDRVRAEVERVGTVEANVVG